jgi:type IV secretory pathway VirB6-like protein
MKSFPTTAPFIVIALLIMLLCGVGGEAHASPLQQASGGIEAYCPEDGTLFERIVVCLESTVIQTTIYFMDEFYPAVQTIVYAALLLAVVLFGSKVLLGMVEKLEQETILFLFKFGGILYFVTESNAIYLDFIDILTGTINDLANATAQTGSLHCPAETASATTTAPIWHRADCIFDMVVGLSANAAINGSGGEEGLARGMMGFFYYNLQSGALGILIGLVGLYICFNLLMALLRASYTYIISLITLSFIFVIGVLFIPLIIFGFTFSIFERWFKMGLAMIIQPLILFAYLNVLFVAFDTLLYSGDNSLMSTIAGGAVGDDFNLHRYAEDNQLYIDQGGSIGLTLDVDRSRLTQGTQAQNEGVFGNIVTTDTKPNYNDPSQLPIHLKYRTVDYTKIDGGAAALAGATLLVGLCSYILLTFMREVPMLAQNLAGGVMTSPSVIAGHGGGIQMPFARQGAQLSNAMGSKLSGLIGGRG